jgi:hypothetical protein
VIQSQASAQVEAATAMLELAMTRVVVSKIYLTAPLVVFKKSVHHQN